MGLPDVEARVKEILTTRLGMPPEDLIPGARLADDLGMDSLDAVELAIATEREFGVAISDEQVARLATVGDIVALLHQLTGEPPPPARAG